MRILKAKSGLTVLFRPMKSSLVDMRYFVRVGAIDETRPGDEGLCHALEHMLFQGTEKRSWLEINRDWEKLGAWYNAWTCHDRTFYLVTCLKKYWQEGYEILADMLYNPIFPRDRWEEIEKNAVISEIQGLEDDPEIFLEESAFRDALGPRYHPTQGNIANIRSADVIDLASFHGRYYCGKNVVLAISGDLTEAQVLRAVNKYDRLQEDDLPPKRAQFDFGLNFDYKETTVTKRELEQIGIQLLKPVPFPKTLKGEIALGLVSGCLSQYIFEELREKRGLCYGASANLYLDIPKNVFLLVKTATDKPRFEQTRKAVYAALESFESEGLTAERLRNIKRKALFDNAEASEKVESSSNWLWEAWGKGVREDPFDVQKSILETLSNSTIRRAANRALAGQIKFSSIKQRGLLGLGRF